MILLSWKKKALMPVILFWTVCICGGDFMHGIYAVPVNETDIARVLILKKVMMPRRNSWIWLKNTE